MLFGDAWSATMLLFKLSYYHFSIIVINTKRYFWWCYQPCRQFETMNARSAQMWRLNKSVEGAFMMNDERENTSPVVSSANPDATVITAISSARSVSKSCRTRFMIITSWTSHHAVQIPALASTLGCYPICYIFSFSYQLLYFIVYAVVAIRT